MSTPASPRTRSSSPVAKAAKAGQGNRNVWVIVAVVAVVAFAAIIAVALSQESGSDDGAAETADVTVTGDALPDMTTDPEGAVGMAAPELEGTDLDGEPISITNDGQPKVIGFFAHWCPHCQNEVPVIVDWQEAGNQPDDVDFYGVSTNVTPARGNYPPSDWFDEEGWTTPTMKDDGASSAYVAFGAGGFPYWVAVGADGNVVARTSGELGADQITQLFEQAAAS
jgi:cytochrome c biogenesis protein CcmG, thiol:disulfide interchange protein DsbE